MPRHATKRSFRARRLSAAGAATACTFALACTIALGTAQVASAAPAAAAVAGSTAQAAGTTTYTVKPGDNLSAIAQSHHVPGGWQAIASANHISSPYIIQPGQVLTLPTGSPPPAKPASTATTATTASAAKPASTAKPASSVQTYPNNLDGWIRHSLAVMAQNGIPGSYNGIYRNIMRESSGNPNAINLWDSNAAAGHPSIGLLQVIQPTFNAYHVPGTSWNIYDPVANITAACNYAYHRYGSIDNVNGPY